MDEGDRRERLDIPMNADLWAQLHTGPGATSDLAIARVRDRGLEELRRRERYSEVEIDFVRNDPLFGSSAREEYLGAQDLFQRRRQVPPRLRIEFHPPASRAKSRWWGG